jgi:hypothetical protein
MKRFVKDQYVVEVHEKEQIPGHDIKLYHNGDFIGYSIWNKEFKNFLKEKGYIEE